MANAHSLLSQSRWSGVDLADLVRNQLSPYVTMANTTIGGPDVKLTPTTTQALAMALHELVTNAAKYGALSNPNGHVSVNWDRDQLESARPWVKIEWREGGGAPGGKPSKPGDGTSPIRELIPHQLGGTVGTSLPAPRLR